MYSLNSKILAFVVPPLQTSILSLSYPSDVDSSSLPSSLSSSLFPPSTISLFLTSPIRLTFHSKEIEKHSFPRNPHRVYCTYQNSSSSSPPSHDSHLATTRPPTLDSASNSSAPSNFKKIDNILVSTSLVPSDMNEPDNTLPSLSSISSLDPTTTRLPSNSSSSSSSSSPPSYPPLPDTNPIKSAMVFRSVALIKALDRWVTTKEETIQRLKCPFFRRRFTDIISPVRMVLEFLRVRHKKILDLDWDWDWDGHRETSSPSTLASSSTLSSSPSTSASSFYSKKLNKWPEKIIGRSPQQVLHIIEQDFTKRAYYVTGKLSPDIYEDDCCFDGPDPDVPVRGLYKYIDATSNLFHKKRSTCDLLLSQLYINPLQLQREQQNCQVMDKLETQDFNQVVEYLKSQTALSQKDIDSCVAIVHTAWRLEAVLRLPWEPKVKSYLGKTWYFINHRGLVYRHQEAWSISPWDAFISTLLFPGFGDPPAPTAQQLRAMPSEKRNQYIDKAIHM